MSLPLIILLIFCVSCEITETDRFIRTNEYGGRRQGVFDSYFHVTDLEEYRNVCQDYESESCAKEWIEDINIIGRRNANRITNLAFRYSTNITTENEYLKMKFRQKYLKVEMRMKETLRKFQWKSFKSQEIRRIFMIMTQTIQSSDQHISKTLLDINSRIGHLYNHARPCHNEQCLEEGESDIVNLFRKDRDYDKLAGFWSSWRNATGRRLKELFIKRMILENLGAKEHGYRDAASFKLQKDFEEDNFNDTAINLYDEILPLYRELHGYVRYCLSLYYPSRFDETGPIPAHILGNVWAQKWTNILPILQMCRRKVNNYSMQKEAHKKLKSLSVKDMFKMAEEFFTSVGMYQMTPEFWARSVTRQGASRLMDCHGSAYDFTNGFDYRIKMCTNKNVDDFTTIHHEMGHIQYFMAYRHLHVSLLTSANPAFHEAVGDTIALSVKTPEHLKKIGLIEKIPSSEDFDLDYLMATALEKVAFLPFALTVDSYMWSVYNGSVPLDKLNQHWWNLRYRFQGIGPPMKRTEDDFDPASKYHIAFGFTYLRYFVSFIQQFQFYESLCDISGHQGPLHRCDFYRSLEAGQRFLEMLKKGRSLHWKETLEILTGTREISSKSLLKYFAPLYRWLKETNERLGVPIGW